jgi:hypothetical protein
MPGLDGDDAETLVAAGLAPCRPPVGAGEEVPHRLIEVAQCLLLNHLAPGPQPVVFFADLGELGCLRAEAWRVATSRTPPRMLFHGQVPHEPGMGAMLLEHDFLVSRRCQAKARHSNIISITNDILGR